MAHNLNYNQQNNEYSFFSVKQKAWHNLGKIVEKYPTSAEAIQFAGLDYKVEKRPLFTYDTENHYGETDTIIPEIAVPNYYATVRTDTEDVLGVVGRDYEIVQNVDAFQFFDAIVGGGEGILYGALGKGERIFITAKLPGYIRVGKEDLIEQYLFLTTSHNGFGSITAAFTPIRIVCNNTLNAALGNHSNAIKIRHTSSANDRIRQAHTLMALAAACPPNWMAYSTTGLLCASRMRRLKSWCRSPWHLTKRCCRNCRTVSAMNYRRFIPMWWTRFMNTPWAARASNW
jgi:phage/plasmid-like protein (TIGR03299 family)